MNTLNDNNLARQQAQDWSSHLGNLAAERSPIDGHDTPIPFPSRLAALLDHFRHRHQIREHAVDKLRAHEFMMGP
jgi:hypothetical protein